MDPDLIARCYRNANQRHLAIGRVFRLSRRMHAKNSIACRTACARSWRLTDCRPSVRKQMTRSSWPVTITASPPCALPHARRPPAFRPRHPRNGPMVPTGSACSGDTLEFQRDANSARFPSWRSLWACLWRLAFIMSETTLSEHRNAVIGCSSGPSSRACPK